MESDLCEEKESTPNDTGQSAADGGQTLVGQLSTVGKVAINDQYGMRIDTGSGDNSLEDASESVVSLSNCEEDGLVPLEDIRGAEINDNIYSVSDRQEGVDILPKPSGTGDASQDCQNYSEINLFIVPENKDIEPDDDMDPLITVDDSESQSSDLINFDTVSYGVIQHPGAEDDDKSIATMSSLSCDINMDSPSKHSQGSNSSSLINLIDASIKDVLVVPASPSCQMLVDAVSSSASSCPSSPCHPPSLTMSPAVEESDCVVPIKTEDANSCVTMNDNLGEVLAEKDSYDLQHIKSESISTEGDGSVDLGCRVCEPSNSQFKEDESISTTHLQPFYGGDESTTENEENCGENMSADYSGEEENCKVVVSENNEIDDSRDTFVESPAQEKISQLSISSEIQTQEKIGDADVTTGELIIDDSVSTTSVAIADSSSSEDIILEVPDSSSASPVHTSNVFSSPVTVSESPPLISSTSDIPIMINSEDRETAASSLLNCENVNDVSSSTVSFHSNLQNGSALEERKNLSPLSEPLSSSAQTSSVISFSVTSTEESTDMRDSDSSNGTVTRVLEEEPPRLNENQSEANEIDKDLVPNKDQDILNQPTAGTPVEDQPKEDMSITTNVPLCNIKTSIEILGSGNLTKNAAFIETAGPIDTAVHVDKVEFSETKVKDLIEVTEICPSSRSLETIPLDSCGSTGQMKRPTSLPNFDSSNLQAKLVQSRSFSDFVGVVSETNYKTALLDDAQQIASSLVDDILDTALLKAEEKIILSANTLSNRMEVVAAAHTLIDDVLNVALAQVSCDHDSENAVLDNVCNSPKDTPVEPVTLQESCSDTRLNSPLSIKNLPVGESVDEPLTPFCEGDVHSSELDHKCDDNIENDHSITETSSELVHLMSNNNVVGDVLEEKRSSALNHTPVVQKSMSTEEETVSTIPRNTINEFEKEEDPSISKPLQENTSVILVNSNLKYETSTFESVLGENIERDSNVDDIIVEGSEECVPSKSEYTQSLLVDGRQMITESQCEDPSTLSNTSSEVDLKTNDKYDKENISGEISRSNSLADAPTKEELERTSSSENGASDSAHSSLLTCSDLGLRSEASIFVDGVLEEAVKKYEESSSSESSPLKLKNLVLDSNFLPEDEELATPCGEMLTEHFMDFESGRNVSVFCSIPDNPSDDHLLAYDRIAHTIGNREVDSDTGKSVSVFRIEDDVYYEIQRASTCTSVFESVEEEDEDMVDTTVPVEERPHRTMRTSASFPSFDRDKLDFADDPLKADSDAFEDAVGAFLAKERLARDERKFLMSKNTKDTGVSNTNTEENTCRALVLRHPEYDLSNQEEKKRMAEKWANGGESQVPDTLEMREKQRLIREALDSDEDVAVKLCKLALTEGGLINDALRREAWPRMLGLDPSLEVDAPSLEDLKSHPEYGQVVLDVNRSLKRFPPDIPKDRRETLQDKLTRLIMYVISKHPHLRYYQGYHDVAVTFLLVVGESVAFQIMERLSTEHLSDCMQPTMERTSYLLHFIYPLLHRLHPTLADYLERSEVGTMFCLPWFLTWFGHSLDRYQDVVRLYDHFLASPPLAPLYVAAVLVAHRADEVLAVDCDMAAIHALLSHIPDTLPLEILLRDATDLYIKFPPESIEREVEERFKNEQELRVHEMEARERVRQRALRRRRGHSHGSWQLAEVNNRFGGTMMTLNRWMPPWVVQQQRLSMRLLFASATFFVGFYVYSRGGDMLQYM